MSESNKLDRPRKELEEISLKLGGKILDLINEDLVGSMPAGQAIYVASSTLAHVAAVVIFSQLGKEKFHRMQALIDGFTAVFAGDAEAILAARGGADDEDGDLGSGSAWGSKA